MKEPIWVSRDVVLATHDEMLDRFGGLSGIRDEGLLDSVLHRPIQLFHYGTPDLYALAAVYASGIIRNHPFLDGNKRSGFMTAYIFLGINSKVLDAPEEEVAQHTLALAAGQADESGYAAWLKTACRKRRNKRAT